MRIGLIRSKLSPEAKWHAEHWQRDKSLCGLLPSAVWESSARKRENELERRLGSSEEVTCGLCQEQLTDRTPTWGDAWTRLGDIPELPGAS